MKKKYDVKRERSMRYSTQKLVQQNFVSGKSIEGRIALSATVNLFMADKMVQSLPVDSTLL